MNARHYVVIFAPTTKTTEQHVRALEAHLGAEGKAVREGVWVIRSSRDSAALVASAVRNHAATFDLLVIPTGGAPYGYGRFAQRDYGIPRE